MNYNNKSNKKILEGLKFIEVQQSLGVRYNLDLLDKFEWYFSNGEVGKKDKEAMAMAVGYIKQRPNQILYSDEMYGIMWGANSNSNMFSFNIMPGFKTFAVVSLINGKWTKLIDWTKSDLIMQDNGTNKLSIAKVDDFLSFYINNVKVGQAPYQQFFGSKIGFFVGPETHVSADNLYIEESEVKSNPRTESSQQLGSRNFISSGSGFLISKKGYFVTNYHVVNGANEVWLETELGGEKRLLQAKVALSDKNNDLAILKLDNLNDVPNPIYGFSQQTVDVGTRVFAMGYPLLSVLGDEIKITDGIINSKTGFQGDVSTYQISAPIQPGNSGGALFDNKGNLVGVTNAGVTSAQNVGYAIKISYLKNLIELLPDRIDLPLASKIENLSFTEKIKELSKFVVIVKVK